MPKLGLAAFIPNGAILPRASGASDAPLDSADAVPFKSPEALSVTIQLPNRGEITGMGVKQGTLLTCIGGGFHGKSTLLSAVSLGCYDHIHGDGREFLSCVPCVSSISSEDGRCVSSVDISAFISNLPNGSDTTCVSNVYNALT